MQRDSHHTEEARRKISIANTGYKQDSARVKKSRAAGRLGGLALKGMPRSFAQREAVRLAWADLESRERRLVSLRRACKSEARNSKLSLRARAHAALDIPDCGCCVHSSGDVYGISALSGKMIETLLAEFPEVISEKHFGRFRVDAYLPPPYHLAFEADGAYWHRDSADYDEARDVYLLEEHGLPVVHLTEAEIEEARNAA